MHQLKNQETMPDAVRSKSKAEVNLLRLAGAFNSDFADSSTGEVAPAWRKLEAYARRMRELLGEVRRGDTPPSSDYLAEYERMLSSAATAADDARRKQDDLTARTGGDDWPAEVRLRCVPALCDPLSCPLCLFPP